MDVSDASYYIQENNENKGSRMGHTKKKYLKKRVFDIDQDSINQNQVN
jgi:hypothetical protein